MKKIGITYIDSISSLGRGKESWEAYKSGEHHLNGLMDLGAVYLNEKVRADLESFLAQRPDLKRLDPSVHYILYLAQELKSLSGKEMGLNMASSRGATHLFERYYDEFSKSDQKEVALLSSPTTTLGNLSSWLAHELNISGFEMSHSITCSSGLHAFINGVIWLESGRSDAFLVGASEASNTPFTLKQMAALKICQFDDTEDFPVRALDFEKKRNTMAVGEGAALVLLENETEKALCYVSGVGYATELVEHPASISARATCFQKSMKMALMDADLDTVDVIVMHAPGTIKGDLSEWNAIEDVFGPERVPALTNNKWNIGHTLGASGIHSLEMGVLMLMHNSFIPNPFLNQDFPENIDTVLVNAVGFGGNAVSVVLSRN
ncbi:MAG: beta-ketoacyl synthase N-terminal-like domain-containing protein [Flavobacteriaceae bacterium]